MLFRSDPETGGPHTAHTTNVVPLVLVGGPSGAKLGDGRLADLAPTLLALMGIAQPSLPGVDGGERALALIAQAQQDLDV